MEARVRRAATAVVLAAALVAAAGMSYLRPWQAFAPPPAPPPSSTSAATSRTAAIEQLRFLSGDVGWVLTGSPGATALFRTTDGGLRWQRQLPGVSAWTVSFFDVRDGVVAGADGRGPAVWRTADGGQLWARSPAPCAISGPVFFLDGIHGWCLTRAGGGVGTGPLAGREEITLYRTVDGGAHWDQVLATDREHPVSGGLGDDGQKLWIWFRDAAHGWIGQNTPGGHAVVYATADAGTGWVRQELPPPAGGWGAVQGTWEEGPEAVAVGSVLALAVLEITAGPQGQGISLSAQNVYTWRSPAWTGPVLVPDGGVQVTDQARWLIANGSTVLQTSDGGASWSQQGSAPPGWQMEHVAMVSRSVGWAVLLRGGPASGLPANGLARTTDGGRHWTMVPAPA